VEDTAGEVTSRGGKGIGVVADLSDEAQVARLFHRIEEECGRLDVLANSVWTPRVHSEWSKPFWEMNPAWWPQMLQTISACWLTGVHAARVMTKAGRGLIAFVTDNYALSDDMSVVDPHADPSAWRGQILHDFGHECINRFVLGMSKGTQRHNVSVVGLNPGFMRTEGVLMHMTTDELKKQFRFDLSETPEYLGRAVAALAGAGDVMNKNGQLLWVADLAQEYGFTDVDGRYVPRFDPNAPMQPFPI
jgi:NAD(P)-dependent dehydrogenase (short-subunit alcohol dehydrogenase family)